MIPYRRPAVSTDKSQIRMGLMLEGGNQANEFFDPGELTPGEEMILIHDRTSDVHHALKLIMNREGKIQYFQQYVEKKSGGWTMEELPLSIMATIGGVRYRISVVSLGTGVNVPVEIPSLLDDE
jgi:hypothetical protein